MGMQPPFATYLTFHKDRTGRCFLDLWLTRTEMRDKKSQLAATPDNTCIITGVLHHTPAIPDDPEIPHLFITHHKDHP